MHILNPRATERAPASNPSTRDGAQREHAVTQRNVRAILIAGDQVGYPGTPTPGAIDSLDIIEHHFTNRFAASNAKIERLAGRPTRQLVVNVLQSMTEITKSGELFVVMFAGHGTASSGAQPSQSWSLTAGEAFTDIDLAIALGSLRPGVDTVVLSDCCFGEGLFQVEHRGDLPSRLRPRNHPMVCISAAGTDNLVELTKLANLARQTVAAADAKHSYRQLSSTFAAQAVAGGTFHVDARPAWRLDDLVLSPVRAVTTGRRPVEPHRRPPARGARTGLLDDLDRPGPMVRASAPIEDFHEENRGRHVQNSAAPAPEQSEGDNGRTDG